MSRMAWVIAVLALGGGSAAAAPAEPRRSERGLPAAVEVREALGQAAQALERKRESVQEEMRRLERLRQEVIAEIERLERVRESMRRPMDAEQAAAQQERDKRLRRMAKSLAAMEPDAAAVALTHMDDGLAVEMLQTIKGRKLGKILEAMSAERAAVLVQAVVERSAVEQRAAAEE